jgi:hypothetical protein
MKIISSFLLLVFFAIAANSQPDLYTGLAKITIKSFWDGATKLEASLAAGGSSLDVDKLALLQLKIRDVKNRDAGYNTASMETKWKTLAEGIDALKKKNETAIQGNRDKALNSQQVGKLLTSLFDVSVQVDNGRLKTVKTDIENYKKRTDELMAIDRSMNKSDLEKCLKTLKVNYNHAENDLTELDRRCREQTNAENAEVKYYELLFNQAHWDAAQRIYPEEADFKKTWALATKLLEGLGSIDDVHNIAAKSKQQKINDTKLPVAAVKDAALEKMFVDAFNKYHGEEFKGVATKAVLTSDDWSIQRNEISGIVTGRIRRAVIVYKGKDGRCYITANFFLLQEYVGSSFSSNARSIYPVMGSQEMLCVNVK